MVLGTLDLGFGSVELIFGLKARRFWEFQVVLAPIFGLENGMGSEGVEYLGERGDLPS